MSGRMGKTSRTRRDRNRAKAGNRSKKLARSKGRTRSKTSTIVVVAGVVAAALVATLFFLARSTHPPFDEARSFEYLQELVAFGPRPPGSAAHAAVADWLEAELEPFADQVSRQSVVVHAKGDTLRGANIIASFNLQPKKNTRIMLSAHWDTRPWADQDPDSAARSSPVLGANDGGSGVAILLEIARVLSKNPLDIGIDLVLFDLEDSGQDTTVLFALGSEFFAANNTEYRPTFGINIDMVCDSTLEISKEVNSVRGARQIVDLIWEAAEKEGADVFVDRAGIAVLDDHIAFLQRGIRVVDLIQTPFPPYWHTLDDTIDKCSSASLGQVGNTLLRVIYAW